MNLTKKVICKKLGLEDFETEFIKELSFIKNPYYTGFVMDSMFSGSKMYKHLKVQIQHSKKKEKEYLSQHDYASFVFLFARPFRLDKFLRIYDNCEKDRGLDYAGQLAARVWIDSENPIVNIDIWVSIFKKYGHNLMSDEDKQEWDNLPNSFIVYHGDEGEKDAGISWTLSKEVAEFFAERFTNNKRKVTSKRVKKSECTCYLNGRSEKEIIIL